MRHRSSLVIAAVLAVLGFLLVTAVSSASVDRRRAVPRKARLIAEIQQRQERVAVLDKQLRTLRADVAVARRDSLRQSALGRQQTAETDALADLAGTTALTGQGLTVSMSDSDRPPSGTEDVGALRIHDTDLQLVVNALFGAGAEAVAVNGSRLVTTSPIRGAGDTIVVNFRPLSPPYVVKAIGASSHRFEDSLIAKRFHRWTRLFGLGFKVQPGSVDVPAFTGRVAIATARAVGGGG